jgi:purine-binding chemotaxis protein CheW
LVANPSVSATEIGTALDLACFETRGRVYGIDVLQIREIVRSREVTPLPGAPGLIEGVIDLRGVVIPVVDLGRVLRVEPAEAVADHRIAILEVEDMVLGLRVDAVVDVIAVDGSQVDAPPALATRAGYDSVSQIVRRADAPPVLVLCLEHLLERVCQSALPPAGAENE